MEDDIEELSMSPTLQDQQDCEDMCSRCLHDVLSGQNHRRLTSLGLLDASGNPRLMREKHVAYLLRGLRSLSPGYVSLDASRPWLCYWILHSLDLLDALPVEWLPACVRQLDRCQTGGFGGGPQQLSHCAPTYAAVLALCIIGTEQALRTIDRKRLYAFFLSVKHDSGGFRMHDGGEVDVRGTYTVLAVAALLNMLTPELVDNVAGYVRACQTYEGGFSGEPGSEAHGGYVFCALAALVILRQTDHLDLDALERWLCRRQMPLEGGFQGRTNKLVDACYSFWQGGTLALVELLKQGHTLDSHGSLQLHRRPPHHDDGQHQLPADGVYACDELALQQYILLCSQQTPDGGLRDKPGKPRDYYHTCYALSGLAALQHFDERPNLTYGSSENTLQPVHPVFNIRTDKVRSAVRFFADAPSTHHDLLA